MTMPYPEPFPTDVDFSMPYSKVLAEAVELKTVVPEEEDEQ